MKDLSKVTTRILKKGERIYMLDSGHVFLVRTIKNDAASIHGNEAFRIYATELDENHNGVIRNDGKLAYDEHGHGVQFQIERPVDMVAELLQITEEYLTNNMVNASNNAKLQSPDLLEMFVNSTELGEHERPHSMPRALSKDYNVQL